jgi:hypothetical protein
LFRGVTEGSEPCSGDFRGSDESGEKGDEGDVTGFRGDVHCGYRI